MATSNAKVHMRLVGVSLIRGFVTEKTTVEITSTKNHAVSKLINLSEKCIVFIESPS